MTARELDKELNKIIQQFVDDYHSLDFRSALKYAARKKRRRNYCKDLNAIHEVAIILNNLFKQQDNRVKLKIQKSDPIAEYENFLQGVADKWNICGIFVAPAWMRAEAIVRTIHKWNDKWDNVVRLPRNLILAV
jgi:hypothetical protein